MKRLMRYVVVGLAVVGVLLSAALGWIWASLYNDPCKAYSWDRESGQPLITHFEPELCYRGGPRQTFTGTLLFAGWGPYFSPKADAVIGDGSWVPARLPHVFRQYFLDHVATPDRDGHALLRVQFIGSRLDRYPMPLFRIYAVDGPGDTVIHIERFTRVERDVRNPRSPGSEPGVR